LTQIGVHFDTLSLSDDTPGFPEIDETPLPGEAADVYVLRLAQAKAGHGQRLVDGRKLAAQPILAADTTLEVDGAIIGKPTDAKDAIAILRRLSGRGHRVLTGVAVAFAGRMETALSVSDVRFRELETAEIHHYVASGEPMDKAGAYGIQGRAGLFVEHIKGSYTGIMGLPLYETGCLLKRLGYLFA
jgi:septum formation protein